jgi:hypothetical protein
MKRTTVLILVLVLAFGLAPAAQADLDANEGSDNVTLVGNWDDDGGYRQGSDLAFWGNLAVLGKYEGMHLLDISRRDNPREVGRLDCNGNQNDVSIWKDLVFISVDSPMQHEGCDSPPATPVEYASGQAWEGIRIVDVSNPKEPEQINTVFTDCGSHTHTLVPDLEHRDDAGRLDPRVILYSSSYPLGGQGVECNAVTHRKISVVEVPLRDPSRARVVSTPDVSPSVGCHDITVFMARQLAVAACISETQIWDISDPAEPLILSHIYNPMMQIHHSSAVSWDGDIAVLGDEKGGAAAASGCNTGGNAPTGALWFYDISDPLDPKQLSYFVIPQNEVSTMCTAHNFNVIPLRNRDERILVTSWYHGGTHMIDFTDAENPQQVAWFKAKEGVRGTPWSSYWYRGSIFANNFDAGYVPPVPESRGLDVLEVSHPILDDAMSLTHLNPQTQEAHPGLPPRNAGGVSAAQRAMAGKVAPPAAPAQAPTVRPFCVL